MRILVLNQTAPASAHISSVRAPTFAAELARRGHSVLLLTPTAEGHQPTTPGALDAWLKEGAAGLFHFSAPPHGDPFAAAARLPPVLRSGVTTVRLLALDGMDGAWAAAARACLPQIARSFRPDVVWGPFGGISTLLLMRDAARMAGGRWVIDFKDNWLNYIPPPLAPLVARRLHTAAILTANSHLHAEAASTNNRQQAHVVYSGIHPAMLEHVCDVDPQRFRITLTGSLYRNDQAAAFIAAIQQWCAASTNRRQVTLVYAGPEPSVFSEIARNAAPQIETEVHGYLPMMALANLCQRAAVNAYINLPQTFHHKMLELIACGRPVASFPGEIEEAKALARSIGASFSPCENDADLCRTFDQAWRAWSYRTTPPPARLDAFRWEVLAVHLEDVLSRAIAADAP